MKRITLGTLTGLIALLCLFLMNPIKASAWGGSGTSSDPYKISTKEDLIKFCNIVNGRHYETGNSAAWGELTADINLSSEDDWEGIGSSSTKYTGTFNGKGYKITCNGTLFDYIGVNGKVINLSIEGGEIAEENEGTVQNCRRHGEAHGGMVGTNYGTVKECVNYAMVTRASGSFLNTGGLVDDNFGTVSECYNAGNIIIDEGENNPYNYGGGIVGRCGDAYESKTGTVSDCYNTGMISAKAASGYPGYYQGIPAGVVGLLEKGSVANCYSMKGPILGNKADGTTVTNCFSLDNDETEGVTRITEDQLKLQTTFTTWDFSDVWEMGTARPKLKKLFDHEHAWAVTLLPDGASATVKCTEAECPYTTGEEYTITLLANDSVYNMNSKEASLTCSPSNIPVSSLISYTKIEGWYPPDPYPIFQGTYRASVTIADSYQIYKDFTIYESGKLKVAFDLNGKPGIVPSAQYVSSGEKAERPSDPSSEGFIFYDWYKEAECENPYDFDETVTSAVTIYAGWIEPTLETPVFTPAGGTYSSAQSVTITCGSEDAEIRYTTDGTKPTKESALYTSAIPVAETTTIKAVAVKNGVIGSAVATALYTISSTPAVKYTVTVKNGTGSGDYEAGATVTIKANDPEEGKVFDKWTSEDGVTFADAAAVSTTFVMPAKAVTVTAAYKDKEKDKDEDDIPVHVHNLKHHDRVEPTEENEGSIEYWECEDCKKLFSDAEGSKEISLADTVLPKLPNPTKEKIVKSSEPVVEKINDVQVNMKLEVSYPQAVTWTGAKISKGQLEALSGDAGIAKMNLTGLEEALKGKMAEGTDVSKLFAYTYTISKDKNVGDKGSFKVKVKLNAKAVKKAKIKGPDKKLLSAMVKKLNVQLKNVEYKFDIAPIKLKDADSVTIKAKLKNGALQLDEKKELTGLKSVKVKVSINGVKKAKTFNFSAKKASKLFKISITDEAKLKADLTALEGTGFTGTRKDITITK